MHAVTILERLNVPNQAAFANFVISTGRDRLVGRSDRDFRVGNNTAHAAMLS